MSYHNLDNNLNVADVDGNIINPATEEMQTSTNDEIVALPQEFNDQSIWLLRKIAQLLKPLGVITGSGSNRVSVDVNSAILAAETTKVIGTINIAAAQTVAALTNITNIGNVNAFCGEKSTAQNAYANAMRRNLTF